MDKNELANALEQLAQAVRQDATTVIGQEISVSAGPGATGNIIGQRISVSAGPGSTGNIIGQRISVSVGGPIGIPPATARLIDDLQEVAGQVRAGAAPMDRVNKLVAFAKDLGGRVATGIAANLLTRLVIPG